jgi:hypothetical protein
LFKIAIHRRFLLSKKYKEYRQIKIVDARGVYQQKGEDQAHRPYDPHQLLVIDLMSKMGR